MRRIATPGNIFFFFSTSVFLFSIKVGDVSAQNDWGSSLSVGVSKKLFSMVTVVLEEDFRLRDNFSTVDRFSTTLELNGKPWKFLKVGGAYNLINFNHAKKGWEVRHRYYFYATGSVSFHRFNLSLRERFQSTYRSGVEATDKRANPKLYLRSRLKVEYDIRQSGFTPFLSGEIFTTLNDPQENSTNKVRINAGTEIKLNKKNALDVYYRYTGYLDDDEDSGNMIVVGFLHKF